MFTLESRRQKPVCIYTATNRKAALVDRRWFPALETGSRNMGSSRSRLQAGRRMPQPDHACTYVHTTQKHNASSHIYSMNGDIKAIHQQFQGLQRPVLASGFCKWGCFNLYYYYICLVASFRIKCHKQETGLCLACQCDAWKTYTLAWQLTNTISCKWAIYLGLYTLCLLSINSCDNQVRRQCR